MDGYEIVEIVIRQGSPAQGHRIGEVAWPAGCLVVAVTDRHELVTPRPDIDLRAGEAVVVLAPTSSPDQG